MISTHSSRILSQTASPLPGYVTLGKSFLPSLNFLIWETYITYLVRLLWGLNERANRKE